MSASHLPTARLASKGRSGDETVVRRGTTRSPRPAATPVSEAPLVLGRYRLHRRLGAGAFGTVWMARDERLDRDVAVKIVPRARIVGGRFEREARAAARLSHPGIVTLHEAAVDDEGAYLVSELVRGWTLARLLEAGQLSDRDIVAVAIALCEALDYAHHEGIVHRDVKPSNVLVAERPSAPAQLVKLTDFGVARVIGGDTLTRTGDVVGTAAYMAPEQAEGLEAGPPADLYAVALVTYEALTGVNPVRAGTAAAHARRLGAYLPPLRRQRRDLPRELGRAIDLALRPRPRERGTLSELRGALEATLPEMGDVPGVVLGPREGGADPAVAASAHCAESLSAAPHGRDADRAVEENVDHAGIPWPARALSAAAAAGTVGWLVAHVPLAAPVTPTAAALVAAVTVAALPRVGWLIACLALAIACAAHHRPGAAVLLSLAVLMPMLLLPRRGSAWPLAAGAVGLGLAGLAGAWPSVAARAAGPWRRAALGASGWVWLVLMAPIAGRGLYLRHLAGLGGAAQPLGSLNGAFNLALRPILDSGALAGAVVWAAAAVVLPWLLRGRSLAMDVVLAVVWAATVASATQTAIDLVHPAGAGTASGAVAAGAVASVVVALAPSVFRALRVGRARAGLP